MGFLNERCPNCGKAVSKNADFCNFCGCPTATGWATCHSCGSSVGIDSKFCWKCGAEQQPGQRVKFYGDRWRRSATDFAVRVELNTPETVLHNGLQVDEGTLALIFQNGRLLSTLEPGYHTLNNFLQRVLGLDKGKQAHAILLDMRSAETTFEISGLQVAGNLPVDVRAVLLFQITDSKTFVSSMVKTEAATFTTEDLSRSFEPEVRDALQSAIAGLDLNDLLMLGGMRARVETEVVNALQPRLAAYGLKVVGLRLVDFLGQAVEGVRSKLGELAQLNREFDLNRRLEEALRREKVESFRSEQEARDYYAKITDEFGLRDAEREQLKKRWLQAAESQTQLEGVRHDYQVRRQEILNRLDEQALEHESEMAGVTAKITRDRAVFEEELRQQQARFDVQHDQRLKKAWADKVIAEQGIDTLAKLKAVKLEARKAEDAHEIALEAERIKLRGDASLQGLIATLPAEQADRLLKLAEMEMRKGLSAEQSLALVAEKSPEIAPSIAAALQARYSSPQSDNA